MSFYIYELMYELVSTNTFNPINNVLALQNTLNKTR